MLHRATQAIPLGVYERVIRRDAIGLLYHAVSDEEMAHVRYLYPPVTAAAFEEALIYLTRRYHLVSYEEMHAHRMEGAPLPKRALHISFDDGFAECFHVARPLLLKHKVPCTFFVTTDWIDNGKMFYRNKISLCIARVEEMAGRGERLEEIFGRISEEFGVEIEGRAEFAAWIKGLVQADEGIVEGVCALLGVDWQTYLVEKKPYMTREQIRQMAEEGFTIGAHSCSHPKLGRVSAARREEEIVESARVVLGISEAAQVPFAFPHSAQGVERAFLADVRARHPFLGLFFDTQDLRRDVDLVVKRIWAETPLVAQEATKTNLPEVLHKAYARQAWENMQAVGGRG